MTKPLLSSIFFILSAAATFAQTKPTISYSGPQTYTAGTIITPLTPQNTGGAVPATEYGVGSVFAGADNTGNNDGTGTEARFYGPSGIAADKAGNIYVTEQQNNLVRKITPAGVVTTLAGNNAASFKDGQGTAASFNNPCGIAVDANGNVFVADRYNNRIRKITPAGLVTTFAGSGSAGSTDATGKNASFYYPYGISIDASGNLYVADQLNNKIRKITSAGVVTTIAGTGYEDYNDGTAANASFYRPTAVVMDSQGNLLVADNGNNRIRKITPGGIVSTLAGNGNTGQSNGLAANATFSQVTGIVLDEQGAIYIADQGNNLIRKIANGTVSTFAGSELGLANPTGVTIANGKLYIVSYYGPNVKAVNLTGYSIDSALPQGLLFDNITGTISGTPQVAAAAKTYTITAVNQYGTATATVSIAVAIPALPPTLTSISPTTSAVGNIIVVRGQNFSGATQVTINGQNIEKFLINSSSQITLTIPADAESGDIAVTNPYGTATIGGLVLQTIPDINYQTPQKYNTGVAIAALSPINSGGAVPAGFNKQVKTFAGSGSAGKANGMGTAASFYNPDNLAIDGAGNIYVADQQYNLIRKITPAGEVTTFAGDGTAGFKNGNGTNARLNNPCGLVFDAFGNLFVADAGNNMIRKITSNGDVSTFAGNGDYGNVDGAGANTKFNTPTGIAINSAGDFFVVDKYNNSIRKISPVGVVSTFVAGNYYYNSYLYYPQDITIDNDDNLYVSEDYNSSVKKITPDGSVQSFIANPGFGVRGITVCAGGLYLAGDNGIYKVNAKGVLTKIAGADAAGNSTDGFGEFASVGNPNGVVYDGNGTIYFSDTHSHTIRMLTLLGYSVKPALPAGLSMDENGVITGSPIKVSASANYTVTAVNQAGTSDGVVKISVSIPASPPTITSFSDNMTAGKTFTITGTNLLGVTKVKAGDTELKFGVVSPTTIAAVLTTSTPGDITITNPYGTATLAFTLGQAPAISYTSPQTFFLGTPVDGIVPQSTGSAIPETAYGLTTTFATSATPPNDYDSYPTIRSSVTDISGNVYITQNNKILKINSEGVVTDFAGTGAYGSDNGDIKAATFSDPRGLAIDLAGNIYVADAGSRKIRKITVDGIVTTLAGNGAYGVKDGLAENSSFISPIDIAIDLQGNIFVTDQDASRIRKITPDGIVSTFAGSGTPGLKNGTGTSAQFNYPNGLTIDVAGNLYLADQGNNVIRKITPQAVVTTYAGTGTNGMVNGNAANARFYYPSDVKVDNFGNLYVVDAGNEIVRKISPDGIVSTLAGNGSYTAVDGIGQLAGFHYPTYLSTDNNGNLYVAEGTQNLRKISLTGYTITPDALADLVFDNATGKISGTPSALLPVIEYTVTGINSIGFSTAKLTFDVQAPKAPPVIASFLPTAAAAGNIITIKGDNFTSATAVKIGGVDASGYTVISPSIITAVVSATATGADISIVNNYGTATATGFSLINAPAISYTASQNYTTGTTITPLNVTNSGSAIPNALYAQTTTLATTHAGQEQFSFLQAPAKDAAGNIYVIDQNSNSIKKIATDGKVTVFAGFGSGVESSEILWEPMGIVIDANDNLYVTDSYGNAIKKVSPAGVISTFAGNGQMGRDDGKGVNARFNNPTGIAIDAAGFLYVTDQGNYLIRRISPTGIVTTFAGTGESGIKDGTVDKAQFYSPRGVTTDISANIYVTDGNAIRKITPAGVVSTLAGNIITPGTANATGTDARFNLPKGITTDMAGNIFVSDYNNCNIRKITPAGVVTTLVGNGVSSVINAVGTDAGFSHPTGVFIDETGDLLVTEASVEGIRKVSLTGYIINPTLPDGLNIDGSGTITGKPANISPTTSYTITGYNKYGHSSSAVTITVSLSKVAPTIASFTPKNINGGATVVITGNNFLGATTVTIGGVAALNYSVISGTTIHAVAAGNATSGSVTVTNAYGTATASGVVLNKPPVIAYANNLAFTAGVAITAVKPTNTGTTIPATTFSQLSIVAGSTTAGGTDATGTNASFSYPVGITKDVAGNLYIVDLYNSTIRKITPAGVVTTLAGKKGTYGNQNGTGTAATFNNAMNIVSDKAGNLFVTEYNNNLIRKITPAGVVTTFAGNGTNATKDGKGIASSFNRPTGIAIDLANNLYVTQLTCIRKITPAGVVTTLAGGSDFGFADGNGTAAKFNYPIGITTDNKNNVYVADANNARIRKITPAGVVSTFAGNGNIAVVNGSALSASFMYLRNLTFDVNGNMYVTEDGGIRKIDTKAIVTTVVTKEQLKRETNWGTVYAQLQGIVVDNDGNLVFTDAENNQIRKITLTGYNIDHNLPDGLIFNSATGIVTGTPVNYTPSALNYTVTGYNSYGASAATLSFKVNKPALPKISYSKAVVYTTGSKIAPLLPTNTGGAVPQYGYGKAVTIAGTGLPGTIMGGSLTAQLWNPSGLVQLANGDIYLTQYGGPYISKITPDNQITKFAGSSWGSADGNLLSASFNGPTDIATDSKGSLFVTDYSNHRIRKISNGKVSTFVGSSAGFTDGKGTAAKLNGPSGLIIDKADNIYLADQLNNRIRKIKPDGTVSTFAGNKTAGKTNATGTAASFYNPDAIVIDSKGNFFVADTKNNLIRKITASAVVTTFAGSGKAASTDGKGVAASFNYPTDITIDAGDNLYVTDYKGNMIRKITPDGTVTTLAGNNQSTSVDGVGVTAGFSQPVSIAMSFDNNALYVSEYGGGVVKKITLGGYTINKPLPAGLNFDAAKGTITGIPTQAVAAADYVITAVNAAGSSPFTVNITVNALEVPKISYASTQRFKVNTAIKPVLPANTGGAVPATIYGQTATFAGSGAEAVSNGTGTGASFSTPINLKFDKFGSLYVANYFGHAISKITSDGVVTTFAGNGDNNSVDGVGTAASLNYPCGLAFDDKGYLYATQIYGAPLHRISPTAVVTKIDPVYYSPTSGGYYNAINYPNGLAFDAASGNLYIADEGNLLVRKYKDGLVSVLAGNGNYGFQNGTGTSATFSYGLKDLTVDGKGNIFVADANNYVIRKITPTGVVSTFAGTGQAGNTDGTTNSATFTTPTGLVIDVAGNMYISDQATNIIRKISTSGVVSTIAGNGSYGKTDGVGTAANFKSPRGMAISPSGQLYVADYGNNVIRTVTLTGYQIDKPLPSGLVFDSKTGTISGTPKVVSAATDYTITAYNYSGSSSAVIKIATGLHDQAVITFKTPATETVTSTDVALTATSTNKTTAIKYTSDNAAVATIVNNKLHIVGAGTVNITASQAASTTLDAAENVVQKVTVTKANQTIAFTATTKNYGSADLVPATATSGLALTYVSSDTKVATIIGGKVHIIAAGTVNITASQAGNATRYNAAKSVVQTITIAKAALKITADNKTKKAGAANPVLTATITGFVNGDDKNDLTAQPKLSTTAVTTSKAGSYAITVTGAVSNNYSITYTAGTMLVSAATVKTNSLSVNADEFTPAPVVQQALSPNGDGVNDVLTIEGIGNYPDNTLMITDVNGNNVYEVKGYDNNTRVFNGRSGKTGAIQKPGTYFYVLQYKDKGETKRVSGYVLIKY